MIQYHDVDLLLAIEGSRGILGTRLECEAQLHCRTAVVARGFHLPIFSAIAC